MENGPIISGRRIKLEPVTLVDLPFLLSLWNDGQVMAHLGFPDGLGFSRDNILKWWNERDLLKETHLIIKNESGRPVGECGWGFGCHRGMLDIKLARNQWGQGVAGKALEALLGYLWNHTTIERVYFTYLRENQAARRLLERFQFVNTELSDDPGSNRESWNLQRPFPPGLPKTLVFDWGGVLMRTFDSEYRRRWEAELGLQDGGVDAAVFESVAWNQAQLGRWSVEKCWNDIGRTLGLESDRLAQFHKDFWAGDRLNQPLAERIAEWKASGYRIALLSNHSLELEQLLDETGVRPLFDLIVISAREGVVKPGAKIFWLICQRLGVSPVQALFVDDFVLNIKGAQYVGMHTVHFQKTQAAICEIEAFLS